MWYFLNFLPKKHLTPLVLVENQNVGSDKIESDSQN